MSNSKRFRLIAVDCDRTFFDNNGYPSPKTCEVVQRVVDAGHAIVAATGRSRHTAEYRLVSIPGMRYLICSNGAYTWDTITSKPVWESQIDHTLVSDIVERLRSAFSDIAFSWESRDGLGYDDAFLRLADGIEGMETGGTTKGLCSEPLYKLKVRRPGVSCSQLEPELINVLGDTCCEISTSGAPFIEITASGAHKGTGVERSATMLGFTMQDVIVFGDNQNDLPMFRCAGHAVAMGNALDIVIAEAHATTLSNTKHGVAHYLESLLDTGQL